MSMKKRDRIWSLCRKQKFKCYFCERKIFPNKKNDCKPRKSMATIDHYIPTSLGGDDTRDNQVAACYICNQKKADAMPSQFLNSSRDADFRN